MKCCARRIAVMYACAAEQQSCSNKQQQTSAGEGACSAALITHGCTVLASSHMATVLLPRNPHLVPADALLPCHTQMQEDTLGHTF